MYVLLDDNLVPGKIKDINKEVNLAGREVKQKGRRDPMYLLNKYKVQKQSMMDILATKDKEFEAVLGTKEEVYFDHDFGFFSAILACYNNHWVLRTSPDDWWSVIAGSVARAVDDNGEKDQINDFFVAHQGQKEIEIKVDTLGGIDYSWLFDQFSCGLRENIKTPGYVDIMQVTQIQSAHAVILQADFSTTAPDQLISSQVMLMASLQKYFTYTVSTRCGIPAVEMLGTEQDWEQLLEKTRKLEALLQPVMGEVKLASWFTSTLVTLEKLVATYRGAPDREWWGHVLSWNETHGSGGRSWWDGWMVDLLMGGQFRQEPEAPGHFQSGLVSVPLKLKDGPVEDIGRLVAGTLGFTVSEGEEGRAPVVQARQGWALLLPRGSPITPLLRA
jgi:hypothetical protein